MCVTASWKETLSGTTAKSPVRTEEPPTAPAISNCDSDPKTTTTPVVFHNLRGYDSHLLMQAISKVEGRMSCIPNNTEKYISFSLGQLRFIDSAQFLQASLSKLVDANKLEAFHITARYEPDHQKRTLLMRKGVYPYEYVDSWERFEETKLPPKEAFYSKLSDEHIDDDDYKHAQRVWETFGCQTLGNYADLYCRTDVLLLADVFENFRKTSQKQYGLDPANYYTSPGLSWGCPPQKHRSRVGAAHRLWPAPLHREGDARRHLDGVEAPRQGEQPRSRGIRPGEAQQPHTLPWR